MSGVFAAILDWRYSPRTGFSRPMGCNSPTNGIVRMKEELFDLLHPQGSLSRKVSESGVSGPVFLISSPVAKIGGRLFSWGKITQRDYPNDQKEKVLC